MTTIMNGFVMIRTTLDAQWYTSGHLQGWDLPDPAFWLWRCWPFRVVRRRFAELDAKYLDDTMALRGLYPTGYNRWVAYAIGRGWC